MVPHAHIVIPPRPIRHKTLAFLVSEGGVRFVFCLRADGKNILRGRFAHRHHGFSHIFAYHDMMVFLSAPLTELLGALPDDVLFAFALEANAFPGC